MSESHSRMAGSASTSIGSGGRRSAPGAFDKRSAIHSIFIRPFRRNWGIVAVRHGGVMKNRWMAARIWIWIVLASMATAACGGAGGGGSPPPSGPSYNLAAGLANLAATDVDASMSISGTSNGFVMTGSAQLTQTAATAATFNAEPSLMQTTTISGTGITTETGNVPLLYSFAQYTSSANTTLGLDTNFNSTLEHAVADSPFDFPSSVKVGDTAILGSMILYLDGAETEDTIQVSYAVTSDPQNTDSVIVEVIYQYFGSLNAGQLYQFNYVLTTAGGMSLQSLSITSPTDTATVDMFMFTVQP